MAKVALGQRAWINLAADPSQLVSVTTDGLGLQTQVQVSTQAYAAGVYRLKRQAGRQQTLKVNVPWCSDAASAQLLDWQGELVCVRDPRGSKVFGVYTDAAPQAMSPDGWSLSFTLQQVTFAETL